MSATLTAVRLVTGKREYLQTGVVGHPSHDREIVAPVDHTRSHLLRATLVEVDVDVGEAFLEAEDVGWHEHPGPRFGRADVQHSSGVGPQVEHGLVGFEREEHDALRVGEEQGPRLGQGQVLLLARQQACAVMSFQGVDLHGDGRLGDEELLGRSREAQVLRDVVEGLELFQVEVETHTAILGDRSDDGKAGPTAVRCGCPALVPAS
jgi:hypothetical protein